MIIKICEYVCWFLYILDILRLDFEFRKMLQRSHVFQEAEPSEWKPSTESSCLKQSIVSSLKQVCVMLCVQVLAIINLEV